MSEANEALAKFTPATRRWFNGAFDSATPAQRGAWAAISAGDNALVIAPTGSGKTLAAFLWALDGFIRDSASGQVAGQLPHDDGAKTESEEARGRTKVLYISPLKALGVDVERNLRAPLIGIKAAAPSMGFEVPEVRVGVRTGDTPARERRRLVTDPPDILITTPESLYLMLTSRARASLTGVHTVIIDEVHAVAGTKRGAHLALSLERLDDLLPHPAQRIGLSATVEPADEVARFLGGSQPVSIVRPPSDKRWDLQVRVPVEDMTELPGAGDFPAPDPELAGPGGGVSASIWPFVESEIVDIVAANRSTIVFVNSRRTAERLTGSLNEIWEARQTEQDGERTDDGGEAPLQTVDATPTEPEFARAHHGSVSKEERALVEDALKSGTLRCVVATSSLELGIDMGSVDAVIQVEAPPSVASSLQRVGRAGHQVGEVSTGVFLPKQRADLVVSTVVVERMRTGALEALSIPANPLDVLAQHTVAAVAMDDLDVDAWFATVRRAAPFAALSEAVFESVLDLLAGRYPSDEFSQLRPRLVWDREAGTLTARPGAQRLAVTSGGTIPDRGLFGVFLAGGDDASSGAGSSGTSTAEAAGTARTGGKRVGELDEEMVYESRVGDVIILGATSWQIKDITHDRVLVTPAFGQPGRLPFWRGEAEGRPVELGLALGRFRAEIGRDISGGSGGKSGTGGTTGSDKTARVPESVVTRLQNAGLDDNAVNNLIDYLAQQQEATGVLPTDTRFVVERFPDELGDWRLILHSPLGNAVHGPWALAIGARLQQRFGFDAAAMAADDGIVLRIPATDDAPPGAEVFMFDPDDLEETVREQVAASALFAARFRENAARALLLPRRDPGRRTPLWQQRQRAAQLLAVASKYPDFPIVLETAREVLQDVYDLPRLREVMTKLGSRAIRVSEVETRTGSPFAQNLLFGYTAQFLYEPDAPLAERRAAALSLDHTLLAQLLGTAELRELLDPDITAQVQAELQRTEPSRRAHGEEGVADLLRLLGPLSAGQLAVRLHPGDGEAGGSGVDNANPDHHATEDQASAWADHLVEAKRALKLKHLNRELYAAIEDAARIRDALGVPLPMGIPHAFIEPVATPLEDVVGRFARTHGPFTTSQAAESLGLPVAVVHQTLTALADDDRVVTGAFLPTFEQSASEQLASEEAGAEPAQPTKAPTWTTQEWCDAEVLRRIRRRSLAALRAEVEPVDGAAYARFLTDLHQFDQPPKPHPSRHVATPVAQRLLKPGLTGVDGVAEVLDQLAGFSAPASAWEHYILPARVADFTPQLLDQVLASGQFLFTGTGPGIGTDGWLAFHHAETADLTLRSVPQSTLDELSGTQKAIMAELADTGAWFFAELHARLTQARTAADAPAPTAEQMLEALWDLLWAGLVTNDTFGAIRAGLASGTTAHKPRSAPPRAARRSRSSRLARLRRLEKFPLSTDAPDAPNFGATGPGGLTGSAGMAGSSLTGTDTARAGGRWSAVPQPNPDATLRSHATTEYLLDRYGVITRGSVLAEQLPGGFGLYYRLLSRMEEAGQVRRGYFIEKLGAAQFSTAASIDSLRTFDTLDDSRGSGHPLPTAVGLAATDPANPYGAALPWPDPPNSSEAGEQRTATHRPGRKAGAVVVLVAGRLALYMERGGRTILNFIDDADEETSAGTTTVAAAALAQALDRGRVEKLSVETVNGAPILGTQLAEALVEAGFYTSPSGLRFRSA